MSCWLVLSGIAHRTLEWRDGFDSSAGRTPAALRVASSRVSFAFAADGAFIVRDESCSVGEFPSRAPALALFVAGEPGLIRIFARRTAFTLSVRDQPSLVGPLASRTATLALVIGRQPGLIGPLASRTATLALVIGRQPGLIGPLASRTLRGAL